MHVISDPPRGPSSTDEGLRALAADVTASEEPVVRDARRRALVRRLTSAGLAPDVLEAVLPGWRRYCEDREDDLPRGQDVAAPEDQAASG